MSTAPMMTESPLALLLDGNAAVAADAQPAVASDPYARWHGFMERAVLNNGVVASVSHFLTQRVAPVWGVDSREPAGRPSRRNRR